MIIKNHKETYRIVGEKLEIDYEIVRSIGDFIYDDLGKRIEDFKHREIYVYCLGAFRFRRKKTEEYIERALKAREFMTRVKRPEEQIQLAERRIEEKIIKMRILISEWDQLMEAKTKFKIRKKEYVDGNLQEQKGDLGGTKESSI